MSQKLDQVIPIDLSNLDKYPRANLQEVRAKIAASVSSQPQAVRSRKCDRRLCSILGGRMEATSLRLEAKKQTMYVCARCGKVRFIHD